ncbi:uncharacterized protein ASCRUDRAFT_157697 [Ascoidea rubescens DSM 1968]|uniref:Uncharacterized protein n=1 Tax=Ascoidea rubescens DSM 1968 TaxID=1344418 RepID=A0A1D2VFE1_9ASCO|nr:hypothetical protein ASCRUDRAFT_157697 [Ascoidea rubescens DSM 1968]ODV60233.1 hypothetical protein ASCRUDRAFT_157697 [Ascoidea rubescens DSM 1968]
MINVDFDSDNDNENSKDDDVSCDKTVSCDKAVDCICVKYCGKYINVDNRDSLSINKEGIRKIYYQEHKKFELFNGMEDSFD